MLKNIKSDLNLYSNNGNFFKKLKIILFSHSFHLVSLYRFGCIIASFPIIGAFLRLILEYFIRIIYSSDISLKSKIGPGLVILHGHDIVVGGSVKIGKNCKIFNGVTLGNKDTETTINQQPLVGDNVVIGTGAKILGAIQIGDNVTIGANSVVINNIPNSVVVAGIPAKIVKKKN